MPAQLQLAQDAPGGVMPKTGSVSAETTAAAGLALPRGPTVAVHPSPCPPALRQKTHPAAEAESCFSTSAPSPLAPGQHSPSASQSGCAGQALADQAELQGPEEAAFEAYVAGHGPDPRSVEFADYDGEEVRFDDCAPIQLERRGTTSHLTEVAGASPVPTWQAEFWGKQTIWKNTIAAKLREQGRDDLADVLTDCHSTFTTCLCSDCGKVRKFPNRCDNFFCAECQPRLASDRRKAVEWWTNLVSQPKHVVLTVKNVPHLTKPHVAEFKRWWAKLRRRKFARNWRGGFYGIECTKEGAGWHLHLHALIDAKWIDGGQLAIQWHSVTNGMGRIVKVKDARKKEYLGELVKYAVKGSDLAQWNGADIVTFIEAFTDTRTFGVFGTLYGARTKFAEFIANMRNAKPKCDCGSCNVQYFSEAEWLERDLRPSVPSKPKPPGPGATTPDMFANEAARAQNVAAFKR